MGITPDYDSKAKNKSVYINKNKKYWQKSENEGEQLTPFHWRDTSLKKP